MIRRISKFLTLALLATLFTPVIAPAFIESSQAARTVKTTICHRTHSVKNPYRLITVSQSAVSNGHSGHDGNPATPVWTTSSVQGDVWGDIIPDAASGGPNGKQKNWDAAGIAIYKGLTINPKSGAPVCGKMTLKQFYDGEVAAGVSISNIVADLNDGISEEDGLLLKTLSGSPTTFSTLNVSQAVTASTAIIVTTSGASSINSSSATLSGSLKVDSTSLTCMFEYDTDSGFGSSNNVTTSTQSGPINATTGFTAAISSLSNNTKYYYRFECYDAASNFLYGSTYSFTTGINYSISYDSNTALSGNTPTDFNSYLSSESANVRGNEGNLIKTGYSFAGWTLNAAETGTVYSPSGANTTLAMTTNRILYAKWTATTFPVIFDSNTATSGTMSNQTYTAGSALALSTNGFNKTGFTFAGWATSSGGSVVYSNTQSITLYETTTVYAKWTAQTYSVTFDSNTATSGTMSNQSFTAGTGQALTTIGFSKTGFSFLGWATSPGGAVVHSNTASITIYADTTLYAKWVSDADWRIDYDGNGNTGGTVPDFQTIARTRPIATQLNTGNLVRTGYRFDGWNTVSGSGGSPIAAGGDFTPTSNTTLYAKWVATSFPITFDSNTASSGSMSNQTFTAGTGQALTGIGFSKTGYTFTGWASTSGGSVVYTDSQTVTLYETTTVYAKWTAGTFTLTFDSNTATSGTMSSQSFTAGSAQAITSNGFTKSGNSFSGWSSTSGGSVEYTNGASLTIYTDTTLYAIWTPAYSVTYTLNGGGGTVPTETDKGGGATFNLANGSGLTKSGFTFAGWSCNSGSTQAAGASYTMPTTALTCVAQWTAVSSGGGSNGGNSGGGNATSAAATTKVTPAVVKKTATLVTLATTPVKSSVVTTPIVTATPTTGTTTPGNSGSTPAATGTSPSTGTTTPGNSGSTPAATGTSPSTGTTMEPGNSGSIPGSGGTSERINVNNTELSQTTAISSTAVKSVSFTGSGVSQVSVLNNEVAVQAKPGFSGKTTVKITVTTEEEVSTITADVLVIPLPVTNPVVKVVSDAKSRIQWIRSPNATSYEVTQNGKLLCTTAGTICTVAQAVSADAPVQIKALGRDQTESTVKQATYVAAPSTPVVPEIALVVNFDTAKYNLDSGDRALIRAFAADVVKYGFTKIDISGHTDSRGGIDNNVLSNNRAKAARAYLLSLLPNLKVTINGYADAINVATNATAEGMTANRRAEFRVVG